MSGLYGIVLELTDVFQYRNPEKAELVRLEDLLIQSLHSMWEARYDKIFFLCYS